MLLNKAENVEDVEDPDPTQTGELVYIKGKSENRSDPVKDSELCLTMTDTVRIIRRVEVCTWVEQDANHSGTLKAYAKQWIPCLQHTILKLEGDTIMPIAYITSEFEAN